MKAPQDKQYEMNFGNRVRDLIEKAGMTQEDFAEEAGVKNSTLQGYLQGKSQPKAETIGNIARALGVTTDELIYGTKGNALAKQEWIRTEDIINALSILVDAYGEYAVITPCSERGSMHIEITDIVLESLADKINALKKVRHELEDAYYKAFDSLFENLYFDNESHTLEFEPDSLPF